jgi:hypothetical protein
VEFQGIRRREGAPLPITVRGEVSQTFVEPLGEVFVESTGDESILGCEVADQSKLQAVLSWLYQRGVEIVSVVPNDDGADSMDPSSRQHLPGRQAP